MAKEQITLSPNNTRIQVTLSAGKAEFEHGMIAFEKAEVYSRYLLGEPLTSYNDLGDVATDTGNGTLTPTAEGIITAVEVEVSDLGVGTIVTGTLAKQDDGGVFATDSTDILDAGADDVPIFPATPAQDDAIYIGLARARFNKIKNVVAGQDGVYSASTPTLEYYNGSAWTALTYTDGMSLLTDLSAGTEITFDTPADWEPVEIDSVTAYWIRIREAHASPSFTTVPAFSQVHLGVALIVDVHVDGTSIFTNNSRPVLQEGKTTRTFVVDDIEAGAFDVSEDITIDTDFVALGTAPQDMKVKVHGHIVNVHDANDVERFTLVLGTKKGVVKSTNPVSSTPVQIVINGKP